MSPPSELDDDAASPSAPTTQTSTHDKQISHVSALQVGLQRKASPFLVGSWTTLSLTLDGRDKITKFLQYWSRLLAYYYSLRRNANGVVPPAAASWQALYTNLSFSRKAIRLGRSVVELEKLRNLSLWTALSMHLGSGSIKGGLPSDDLWKLVGTVLKTLGLCGFWAADNLNFLTSIGCLDDKLCAGGSATYDDRRVLQVRKVRQQEWGIRANRSYFFGSVAGLLVNYKAFLFFRRTQVAAAYQMCKDAKTVEESDAAKDNLKSVKAKQFLVTLDLIKSCCDVLVFSNNPGVNLWEKYRGNKLHEVIHCIGGMVSAAVVMYNNYPNAAVASK